MDMPLINVRCYDRLRVITESLADKCLGYLVRELGRYVVFGRERLNVMDSLHRAFPVKRRSGGEAVAGILVVDKLHLLECGLGISHAVYGRRVQQILGLVGVQYVAQTFVDRSVESDVFTDWNNDSTSFRSISTSAAVTLWVSFALRATWLMLFDITRIPFSRGARSFMS